MEFPAEVQVKATIRPGSVYYFPVEEFSSPEPHFFIVLNNAPRTDEVLILACSSSRIEKVRSRRASLPGTLVEIDTSQYPGFSQRSIIDCNYVLKRTIDEIVLKLSCGQLKVKPDLHASLVDEIRAAMARSPVIDRAVLRALGL